MNLLNVTIDGIKVQVPEGTSVLDAAKLANVDIPTLCYLKDINEIGACRMCLVDVGGRALQAACVYPCSEGLKVITNSPQLLWHILLHLQNRNIPEYPVYLIYDFSIVPVLWKYLWKTFCVSPPDHNHMLCFRR
jgi:predicted molibdopterin-dependent oxidoreductase YjgC